MQINTPTSGDVVVCTSGGMIGSFGYINGFHPRNEGKLELCFDARPFFDGEDVSCSGGTRHFVMPETLIATGKMAQATFERCEHGYNGFPNGDTSIHDVNVWEYHDTALSPYPDVISVDDAFQRRSADYVFELKASPSPLAKHFDKTDPVGRAIFNAAKTFDTISWTKHDTRTIFGERYTLQIGINKIASFRERAGFEQFIRAYNLELHAVDDNHGYLIPNMNVEAWPPLGWRKRTDTPVSFVAH